MTTDLPKRVLIVLYKILNYGGITTYVEDLKRGFGSLGIDCDLVLLGPTDRKPYKKQHSILPGKTESNFEGLTYNPDTGWGGVSVMSYATLARIKEFRAFAKEYDLVYWCLPVPSWSGIKATPKWMSLYRMDIPQIAAIHDGNFRYLYPHLNLVADYLQGVACVHGAAYGSARLYSGTSALIPNPHTTRKLRVPWEDKRAVTLSAHVWKAWKHMDVGVRAAPFLKSSKIILGGDGIERRYMTSPTKTPEKYTGVWDKAIASKRAKYVGMLSGPEMHHYYDNVRSMLDPSYSVNYNKLGSHFNRSIFEAYNHGVVPVAMKENMRLRGVFKADKSHIEICADWSPKQVAAALDHANNLTENEAGDIITYGRDLMRTHCTSKRVATELILLSQGKECGLQVGDVLYNQTGQATDELMESANDIAAGGRPRVRHSEG